MVLGTCMVAPQIYQELSQARSIVQVVQAVQKLSKPVHLFHTLVTSQTPKHTLTMQLRNLIRVHTRRQETLYIRRTVIISAKYWQD